MPMTRNNDLKTQYDDKGFTLVEVIIAVVIMAIAAIPLLHAFSSTANTSSKALIKLRATNAAENIMEDIKALSLEEVVEKYGQASDPVVTAPNFAGKNISGSNAYINKKDDTGTEILPAYKFTIAGSSPTLNSDINSVLDKGGYTATIEVDPTFYPNINTVNLSDFDEINSAHSAIVTVDSKMNAMAFDKFTELNKSMEGPLIKTGDALKTELNNLKREIRIEVTKKGSPVDIDGETVTPVEVTATVSYLVYNNAVEQFVPEGAETQKIFSRKVFSNVSNNRKLNSVFVMYEPLYENAKADGDIIIVHNKDSIEFNLFVIAQNAGGKAEWDDYRKITGRGLILEIYEDEVDDPVTGGKKQPVTLYTNIHESVDYQRPEDPDIKPIQCYLNLDEPFRDPEKSTDKFDDKVYKKIINKRGTWESEEDTRALNARDIDGKYLDSSKVEDKIYDVRVTVEKSTGDEEWPVSVSLTGTIVDRK